MTWFKVAKEDELDTMTSFRNPELVFLSEYGMVTFRQWCIAEIARLARQGRRSRIVYDNYGRMAVTMKPEGERRHG